MSNFTGALGHSVSQLRTIAGLASIIPVTAGAIGLAGISRSRRRGVNFFTSLWPGLVLTTAGVSIDVVGDQNLAVQRPAVFIFNHRNMFDVFVAAALVRRDWTAVGKKELANNPIAGTVGRVVDAVFVDRDDTAAAVDSLRKMENLAKAGLSIIVAPEGTRIGAPRVGAFKKGSFRIAMSAGIPIVPIVIRNVESIAVRNSLLLRPGRVEVAVLKPVPVHEWTLADLSDRIAEVRQSFVDTLNDWPRPSRQ
jgi:putative phosphoserine phosphatase/1-acylglycerol-3-phosphate O-acyltransferase